ncbi:discoidin domain-containing protein, partial [Patescibacteria group bacterium]|nr:discoidin domain-containing protein [Patescibacteria group bacterium]
MNKISKRKLFLILFILIFCSALFFAFFENQEDLQVQAQSCSGIASYQTPGTDVCSDQYSTTYPCSSASNGYTTDYWFGQATGTPKWTYGDLGSKKCISGVRVWIYSADVPQTMNIDVSDDALSWARVVTGWTVSSAENWVYKSFTETAGRYVRLYMTSCNRLYCNLREYSVQTRTYISCSTDGTLCSLDSECCSSNCVDDYDGIGKFCCSPGQCSHNGTCYTDGNCQGLYKCNSGTWINHCSNMVQDCDETGIDCGG